jgi:hypothetical protein
MRPERFRKLLKELQFNEFSLHPADAGISTFARWLPCDPKTALRWANDGGIPDAVAKLLLTMAAAGVKPEEVTRLK